MTNNGLFHRTTNGYYWFDDNFNCYRAPSRLQCRHSTASPLLTSRLLGNNEISVKSDAVVCRVPDLPLQEYKHSEGSFKGRLTVKVIAQDILCTVGRVTRLHDEVRSIHRKVN